MARFRNIIGPNIQRLRVRAGWTQDALAARLQLAGLENVDRVTVAKIEAQIRSIYDFEAIVLAKVLKVDPQELFAVSYQILKSSLPHLLSGEMTE